MIKQNRTVDVSIILKTLPFKTTIPVFSERLLDELRRHEPTNAFHINITEFGFDVVHIYSNDIIRLSFGTITKNYPLLNQEVHLKRSMIIRTQSAVSQAIWFENNVKNEDIRNLIRIMKDIFERFQDFCHINPWMNIVLCHYAITRTHDSQPLPINLAFKRILEVMSGGIFLPYSIGIPDPVEPKMPIHGKLAILAQERITRQAQLLLRVLNYNCGCKYIFTSDSNTFGNSFDVAESVSYCDNIYLSDSQSLSVFDETNLKWLHYGDDHPDKQISPKHQQLIEAMKQELIEKTKNLPPDDDDNQNNSPITDYSEYNYYDDVYDDDNAPDDDNVIDIEVDENDFTDDEHISDDTLDDDNTMIGTNRILDDVYRTFDNTKHSSVFKELANDINDDINDDDDDDISVVGDAVDEDNDENDDDDDSVVGDVEDNDENDDDDDDIISFGNSGQKLSYYYAKA